PARVVTGNATETAATPQTITVTATDPYGNTDTSYSGDKTQIQFSGAGNSSNPVTHPTVNDKNGTPQNFGTSETLNFTNGVASRSMVLYKVETANVAVTDGTLSAAGGGRLTVAVGAASTRRLVGIRPAPQTAGGSQEVTS